MQSSIKVIKVCRFVIGEWLRFKLVVFDLFPVYFGPLQDALGLDLFTFGLHGILEHRLMLVEDALFVFA